MACKKLIQDKCLILCNHIGIETENQKESESLSRIGIDKIQPNPRRDAFGIGACLFL